MPRSRTNATERTKQNRDLVKQVSAELGRKVTVREAQAHRREQKATPAPEGVPYRVKDRVVEYDAKECRPVGEVLARVVEYKILSAGFAQLALHTSASEFAHALADAAVISKAHPLLVKLYELVPEKEEEDDD